MGSPSNPEPILYEPDGVYELIHETFKRRGRLVALRSKAEVLNEVHVTEAYVTEIPLKSASAVLECVVQHSISVIK